MLLRLLQKRGRLRHRCLCPSSRLMLECCVCLGDVVSSRAEVLDAARVCCEYICVVQRTS